MADLDLDNDPAYKALKDSIEKMSGVLAGATTKAEVEKHVDLGGYDPAKFNFKLPTLRADGVEAKFVITEQEMRSVVGVANALASVKTDAAGKVTKVDVERSAAKTNEIAWKIITDARKEAEKGAGDFKTELDKSIQKATGEYKRIDNLDPTNIDEARKIPDKLLPKKLADQRLADVDHKTIEGLASLDLNVLSDKPGSTVNPKSAPQAITGSKNLSV